MERRWTSGTRRIEVLMPLVGPGVLGNGRQGFDARTPDGQVSSELVPAHFRAMIAGRATVQFRIGLTVPIGSPLLTVREGARAL